MSLVPTLVFFGVLQPIATPALEGDGETVLFEVKTRVGQGCLPSPTLFNYIVDWTRRKVLAGTLRARLSKSLELGDGPRLRS